MLHCGVAGPEAPAPARQLSLRLGPLRNGTLRPVHRQSYIEEGAVKFRDQLADE